MPRTTAPDIKPKRKYERRRPLQYVSQRYVGVALPDTIYEALKLRADDTGRSLAGYVRHLIRLDVEGGEG